MRFLGVEDVPIDSLEDFPGNARVHDDAALDESAKINGQYRSVVARQLPSGTRQILAGHGTRGAFRRNGAATLRVELIECDDTEALRINLADNATSQNAGYDEGLLVALLAAAKADGGLPGTGWDEAAYKELVDRLQPAGPEVTYAAAANIPQYEPVGPPPAVSELRDESRADAIRTRVLETPDLPDDVRDYLLAAAARHTVFNYRRAAEYYPHASPGVQALMEDSALVIIDVGDAVARGFARLAETLTGIRELDAADADDPEAPE